MKKLICFILLLCTLTFCGCSTAEEKPNWKDYFQVSYEHIEESQFDNPLDALTALENGTYIHEHDEYTITNKTNEILKSVWVVYDVKPAFKPEFQIKMFVGTLKQGETTVEELSQTRIEIEYGGIGYLDDTTYEVYLSEILFEIKD